MTANVQHTHCADFLGREPSIAGRRVEFLDQSLEGRFECRLVLIAVSADEVDGLSVVVGGLLVVAVCLVDHAQSNVTVVDFGEAYEEVPRRPFGFIEFAVVDHIDGR
jgi:hypothetical protein